MPGYSLAATRCDEDARKIGCARRVVGEHLQSFMFVFGLASSWMNQAATLSILQVK